MCISWSGICKDIILFYCLLFPQRHSILWRNTKIYSIASKFAELHISLSDSYEDLSASTLFSRYVTFFTDTIGCITFDKYSMAIIHGHWIVLLLFLVSGNSLNLVVWCCVLNETNKVNDCQLHLLNETILCIVWSVLHVLPDILISDDQALGARSSAVGWGTALQVGRSRVRFPVVSLEFFIDIILLAALWAWGWLSL